MFGMKRIYLSCLTALLLAGVLILAAIPMSAAAESRYSIWDQSKAYEVDPPLPSNPWKAEGYYGMDYQGEIQERLYTFLDFVNNEENIISQLGGLTVHYEAGGDGGLQVQETGMLISPYGRMIVNRWPDEGYEFYICASGGVMKGYNGYEFDKSLAETMDIEDLWNNYMFPWAGGFTYFFGAREGENGIGYYDMITEDMNLYEYVVNEEYEILEIRRYVADETGENCVYDACVWFTAGDVELPEEVVALLDAHIPAQSKEE